MVLVVLVVVVGEGSEEVWAINFMVGRLTNGPARVRSCLFIFQGTRLIDSASLHQYHDWG